MYKLIITFFLTAAMALVNGQNKNKLNQPLGLYFGGTSYSNEMMGIGYYYFKKDSSFIFLSTTFNPTGLPKGNIKNSYSDTLGGYGKGKWFIKDSFFVIKFEPVFNYNVQNDDVVYHSFLKPPYDTIEVKIHVIDKIDQNPLPTVIYIKDLNRFTVTDTLGFGELRLPFNYKEYRLDITHPEYYDKTIILNPDNNMHEVKVALAKKGFSYVNLVNNLSFPSKFWITEKREISMYNFKKENAGVEKLIQVIENGFVKMPEQKFFLDKIMDELKSLK